MLTSAPATSVTVLGLGPMGSAIARAFLSAGHVTTVWNRSADKAAPLLEAGATPAADPSAAVRASPLVVVCVLDDDAARGVLEPVAADLYGKVVVNFTADTPQRARATAAWAREHGIEYVNGAIMTPAVSIGRPEAVVLYSGSEAVYASRRDTLEALGGSATHLGSDSGRAAAYDVVLLDVFWTAMTGLVHGLALARSEGVAGHEIAPFAQGVLELAGLLAAETAANLDRGSHPGDASAIASNAESMEHIIRASRSNHIDSSVMEAAKSAADRAIAAGRGSDSFSCLTEVLSQR